jgi:hypothetical protein
MLGCHLRDRRAILPWKQLGIDQRKAGHFSGTKAFVDSFSFVFRYELKDTCVSSPA